MKVDKLTKLFEKKQVSLPKSIKDYIDGNMGLPALTKELEDYQKFIMLELKKLYPKGEITVYRGLGYPASKLEGDEDIFSDDSPMSFTESKSTAIAIAKERVMDNPEENGFAIKITVPLDRVYFHYKLDPIGKEHPKEKEVMVLASGESFIVIKKFKGDEFEEEL